MATIGDPKTAPIKLGCCRGRRKLLFLIALLVLLGFGSYGLIFNRHHKGHHHHFHAFEGLVSTMRDETLRLHSTISTMAQEIEALKRQVTYNAQQVPKVDPREFSGESREVIMQELSALKNAQRDMQRRHDLMREQYQYEIDALNVDILVLKKELNLLKQNSGKTSSEEKTNEKGFEDLIDRTKKATRDGFYRIKTFVKEEIPESASKFADSAKHKYEDVKDYVNENAPKFTEKVGTKAKETIETVKNFGQGVGEAAKKGFNNAKEFVDEKAPEMGKKAKESWKKAEEFVKEKGPEVAKKVKETMENGYEKVKNFAGEHGPKVAKKVEETMEKLKRKTEKAREEAKKMTDALFEWVNGRI